MGKHSGKDAPSSSSKKSKSHHHHSSSSSSKSKSKSSSSSHHHHHEPNQLEMFVLDDQPNQRFAQGMPSGRGDRAAEMAQWDAQWNSASSKR
ncbi:hypothetical protein PG993_012875 [Apiospora rasikravindrae]|uniref:Uncharacterized protein n=1 Tax=Apiospora rasikravindrae TaxID=990691 RepID=A0ABR1RW81_9PEZI